MRIFSLLPDLAVFLGISVAVALTATDFWEVLATGAAEAFKLLMDPMKESSTEKLTFLLWAKAPEVEAEAWALTEEEPCTDVLPSAAED
jgi:hypothetical protein